MRMGDQANLALCRVLTIGRPVPRIGCCSRYLLITSPVEGIRAVESSGGLATGGVLFKSVVVFGDTSWK